MVISSESRLKILLKSKPKNKIGLFFGPLSLRKLQTAYSREKTLLLIHFLFLVDQKRTPAQIDFRLFSHIFKWHQSYEKLLKNYPSRPLLWIISLRFCENHFQMRLIQARCSIWTITVNRKYYIISIYRNDFRDLTLWSKLRPSLMTSGDSMIWEFLKSLIEKN